MATLEKQLCLRVIIYLYGMLPICCFVCITYIRLGSAFCSLMILQAHDHGIHFK